MNGQKYDYHLYEYEPVVEETTPDYFAAEEVAAAPLAAPIIVTPQDGGMLTRPVGELIASARESLNDSVLGKPVGELLASAAGDTVLARPVGELLASAKESINDSILAKPVGEVLAAAKDSLGRPRQGGSVTALSSGTWA